MSFTHLRKNARLFLDNPDYCKTKDGLIDLVCRDCDFWKEDERDYECGALLLLKRLLERDVISSAEVVGAASE